MASRSHTSLTHAQTVYENGPIVLCIGAGVHAGTNAILPNWTRLTKLLLTNANVRGRVGDLMKSGLTMPGIYQVLANELGDDFRKVLRSILYEKIQGERWRTIAKRYADERATLVSVGAFCATLRGDAIFPNDRVRAVINLNVDDMLGRVFNEALGKKVFQILDPHDSSSPPKPNDSGEPTGIPVYQVHGTLFSKASDVSKSSVVFTDDEYHSMLGNPLHHGNRIFLGLLSHYPTIFIGTSLTDEHQRMILRESMQIRRTLGFRENGGDRPHILFDGGKDEDAAPAWTRYVEHLGVHRYTIKNSQWKNVSDLFGKIYGSDWTRVYDEFERRLKGPGRGLAGTPK